MKSLNFLASGFFLLLVIAASPVALSGQSTDKAVLRAVQFSDYDRLAGLLLSGADVNQGTEYGFTPLMAASKIGDRMVVGILLSNDANVNAQNRAGATALMIAAKYGHQHVVKQLLEEGADPLLINNSGFRASRFAYAYGHNEVYRILDSAEKNLERL